jgi:hypothetical protein
MNIAKIRPQLATRVVRQALEDFDVYDASARGALLSVDYRSQIFAFAARCCAIPLSLRTGITRCATHAWHDPNVLAIQRAASIEVALVDSRAYLRTAMAAR